MSDRIWSQDKENKNHHGTDIADETIAKSQQFSLDIKPEVTEKPPTRF
jgi:hypothetical protein